MHSVNLDLLRAATRPADPHAHHRSDHLDDLRIARHQRWRNRLARLRSLLRRPPVTTRQPCPEQTS